MPLHDRSSAESLLLVISRDCPFFLQLMQLHSMGISDDAACLQALEATGGDLEAALEILYSK